MGKPLTLLHRIFSFSKASKRSDTRFDLLPSANEHGQGIDRDEHEDPLLATGSIRTTGGIGGLGRGITNAVSEMAPATLTNGSARRRERGMKKRRLRRASLSASNLLSWGQDRVVKASGRTPSDGSLEHAAAQKEELRDEGHKRIEPGQYRSGPSDHGNKEHLQHLKQDKETSKHVGSQKQEGNHLNSGHKQTGDDEQFTRLLRSSSANYKVISETDYRALDPIEHPINALAFPLSSEPCTSQAPRPPSAWTPKSQSRALAFPPLQVPSLMHGPSVTSTTTTSTYRVTVHRRRVHSRTSFPDANRALDHLHSNSSIESLSSSPCPSSEPQDEAPITHIAKATSKGKHSAVSAVASGNRHEQLANSGPGPSMIPRWSSMGHSDKARSRVISQVYHPASVSQIHPVGPLRTVPPVSQRGTMSASTEVASESSFAKAHDTTNDGGGESLIVEEGRELGVVMGEKAYHYTMPLKGNGSSFDDQLESIGDTSVAKSTASKSRNVLKKKRRESPASIVTTREESLKRANSARSEKSSKPESEVGPKNRLRGSLRHVLSVITAVEGVVDRLHASAVGEAGLTPKKPIPRNENSTQSPPVAHIHQTYESSSSNHTASRDPGPSMTPKRSSLSVHDWLVKRTRPEVHTGCQVSVLGTPRDKSRLAKLRRDPSVASLLDMYEVDGSLKRTAFSNTPPGKASEENAPENKAVRGHRIGRVVGIFPKNLAIQTTGIQNKSTVGTNREEQAAVRGPVQSPTSSLGYRDQLSRSVESMGPPTSSQEGLHIELSSSLDRTPDASNQEGMNTSLFVEMGSGGHIESSDDSSVWDSEAINSRREAARRRLEGVDTLRKATGDGEVGENANLKSPTRRASEVFAFLDFPKEDPDSSFEIGALEEYSDEGKCRFGPVQSAQPDGLLPDVGEGDRISRLELDLGQPLSLSTSLLSAKSSPLKKPLGPRDARGAMSGLDDAKKPGQIPSRIPRHTSAKHSRANTSADTSSVPLTGATFESDSFASQNTTDRSIYRGIYSYLRDATSNLASSGKATSKAPSSSPNIIQETPTRDSDNPFLATPLNIDKALPSTPPTELEIEPSPAFHTPKRDVGAFTPLPLFSPISPLDAGMTAQIPRTPETPSPSKQPYKSIVKDRFAEWEGEKPLKVEQERIQRQRSTQASSIPRSLSIKGNDKWARGTSRPPNFDAGKPRGLGDGRVFNAANKPITLEESKNLKPKSYPERLDSRAMSPVKRTGGDPQTNTVKPVDFTQLYPFSEDLFPAIFMPGGPTVVRTSNLLQTPQRHSSQNEPSPASSSKLGVYGREIMALARSKTGRVMDSKQS